MRPTADPGKPSDWQTEPGVFWIYVLRNESSGKLYVGHTNDLAGRLRQHNEPEQNRSLFTKRHPGPWLLVHSEHFSSRSAAMAREQSLKSGQGRDWLRSLLNAGASPPEGLSCSSGCSMEYGRWAEGVWPRHDRCL
jgi:putative endonuclease